MCSCSVGNGVAASLSDNLRPLFGRKKNFSHTIYARIRHNWSSVAGCQTRESFSFFLFFLSSVRGACKFTFSFRRFYWHLNRSRIFSRMRFILIAQLTVSRTPLRFLDQPTTCAAYRSFWTKFSHSILIIIRAHKHLSRSTAVIREKQHKKEI